ncbi:MAG: SHOCT domain-containing protein [Clostridiaceae bacterium]|nr:SHOCT domain-containing protein [Clostridiaceae bacterium]
MRRHIRVRPSKPRMMISLFFGIIMCLVGIFVAIPSFGTFGILWTMLAAGITIANAIPLFSHKNDYYNEVTIEDDVTNIPEDPDPVSYDSDTEQRLARLLELYNKGLITSEEYDQKRRDILDEI